MITITKHNIIVITVSVAIAVSIPFIYLNSRKKKTDPIAIGYKTFHTAAGWGYDIMVNKKLLIHQEHIPVIEEKRGFPSETLAIKTAGWVINKLKNNKAPTLTKTELDHICPRILFIY